MNSILKYIEENLEEELNVKLLAEKIGYCQTISHMLYY